MVDSIGGSNDPAYHAKLRALEAERKRDLERIEERNREQVLKAEEQRKASLENIYETQTDEIRSKHEESQARIDQVKRHSDDYIRNVQADTQKLADQAKHQFESKARVLQKNAAEFDEQRRFLLKQHDDTMKRLKSDHERNYVERNEKAKLEASQAYVRTQKDLASVKEKGDIDLALLRQDQAVQKSREQSEGQRAVDNLRSQRDNDRAALQRQIEFQARAAEEQNKYQRVQYETQIQAMKGDYDSEANSMHRQAQAKLNKEHIKGRRELAEAQSLYASEIEAGRKDASKRIRESEMQGQMRLNSVERENKLNEDRAMQNYRLQKKIIDEQSKATLTESEKRNADLKEKLDTAYKKQSEEMGNQKAAMLTQQREQAAKEIGNVRKMGQEQVNNYNAKNAEELASHGKKAGDAFYQTQRMNASVSDTPEETVLALDVPEHEQDTIRISKQANGITVSGTRRTENKVKTPEGVVAQSSGYQSYSESFPVKGKLEMDKMSRTYQGGRLTFRIPKG